MDLELLDISEDKIKQFNKKNINSIEELVSFYPRKYMDFRNPTNVIEAESGKRCLLICNIRDVVRDMKKKYVKVVMVDTVSGRSVTSVWFHQIYLYNSLYPLIGCDVAIGGVINVDHWGGHFVNPDVFSTDVDAAKGIKPVYSKIRGMSDDFLTNCMSKAIDIYNNSNKEEFSDEILEHFLIPKKRDMLKKIHNPLDEEDIKISRRRLIFENLWAFAGKMIADARLNQKNSRFRAMSLSKCQEFIDKLPYKLTLDQQNVIKSFVQLTQKGERVNALIQGDVGCGKTICAFLLMTAMADNGYQSVLMAPTGVLAKQHYEELKSYAEPMGFRCVYLSGEAKASEKKDILKKIASGEADFIVGTHSVISDKVVFNNLGLTVVDEEHKFGVIQRNALRKKADSGVHNVTMSATPIPRTLAMSLYGDAVSIFNIETMPNGRLPVKTCVANNDNSIMNFMLKEIASGHQCYIVCPLISNDDSLEDYEDAPESVEDVYKRVDAQFEPLGYKVGVITGKMKDEDKNEIIAKFEKNEYQILIATTIIEVGVNVPNATVITIMNAERFGLAGLHQLRGRVGRSNLQSYCILKSNDLYNDRLAVMCATTKGSEIAERDLQIRGSGDFVGTKQSGDNKSVELMLKYPKFYEEIKAWVNKGDSLNF